MQSIRRALEWIQTLIGGTVGGIYLLILYFIAVYSAIFLLSAIQVREHLRDETNSEVIVSFKNVIDQKRSFDDKKRQLENSILQTEIDREIYRFEDQHYYITQDLVTAINASYSNTIDESNPWDYFYSDDYKKLENECKARFGQPQNEICSLITSLNETNEYLEQLYSRQSKENLENPFEARQEEYNKKLQILINRHPLIQHHEIYEWFQYFEMDFLLTIPSPILILFLTVAMGLLGSAVTMTWSYVRRDEGLTVRRFVVLPSIGMISAFIIFIFINAGQMTLTTDPGSSDLNAFALSFIGIISGLLSERAYIRISDVGNTFFKAKEGQTRWAIGLAEAMKSSALSMDDLSRHLGLAQSEVARIVEQSAPATQYQQQLIAAFVRRPVRDIFTDLPPLEKGDGLVAVPDLTGTSEPAAADSLTAAGLLLGAVTTRPNAAAASGTVIGQSPEPGQLVRPKAAIDLTVSSGPPETA